MSSASSSLETYSPNEGGSITTEASGISKSALIIAALVVVAFLYFRNRK